MHINITIQPKNPRSTIRNQGGLSRLMQDGHMGIRRPVCGQHASALLQSMQLGDQQLALIGTGLLQDLHGKRVTSKDGHATSAPPVFRDATNANQNAARHEKPRGAR